MSIEAAYRAMKARQRREEQEERELILEINSMKQNVDERLSYLIKVTKRSDVTFLKNWLKRKTNTKF